jgi:hypothetical protein
MDHLQPYAHDIATCDVSFFRKLKKKALKDGKFADSPDYQNFF